MIPAPLSIGTINLENGECVKGFLAENAAIQGAKNIFNDAGWRAYLSCCSAIKC